MPKQATNITYDAELLRKSIHILSLLIPIVAWFMDRSDAVLSLVVLFVASLIFDIERTRPSLLGRLCRATLGHIIRPHEQRSALGLPPLSGSTWMLLAAAITFAIFPKEIATAAFSMLILGDTAAALIGRRYGTIRFGAKRKSLEGSLAFFTISLLVVLLTPGLPFWVGAAGALAATLAEALPIPLDDNLTVPLLAGLVMANSL